MPVEQVPVKQTTSDYGTAAAATAVVLTYAALPGLAHRLHSIIASYSAAPTGGTLKVEDGSGVTVFQCHITAAGPTVIPLPVGLIGSKNTALVVTLASGAGAVVGMLNCQHSLY